METRNQGTFHGTALPPLPPRLRRNVATVLTDLDFEAVTIAARVTGRSVARYLREVIIADAEKVVRQWQAENRAQPKSA